MNTPASIHGHPIHPMLVTVPIGLWLFSFVCDLVFILGTGDLVWSDVAFFTLAGGLVGALAAAIPGLIDFFSIRDAEAKRTARTHMTLNLVVVALVAINIWLRWTSPVDAVLPYLISAVSIAMLAVSGWLGGKLVYVLGIATPAAPPRQVERDVGLDARLGRGHR